MSVGKQGGGPLGKCGGWIFGASRILPWAGRLVPWKWFLLVLVAGGTGFWQFPTLEGLGWIQASTVPSQKRHFTFPPDPRPCTSRDMEKSRSSEERGGPLGGVDVAAPP